MRSALVIALLASTLLSGVMAATVPVTVGNTGCTTVPGSIYFGSSYSGESQCSDFVPNPHITVAVGDTIMLSVYATGQSLCPSTSPIDHTAQYGSASCQPPTTTNYMFNIADTVSVLYLVTADDAHHLTIQVAALSSTAEVSSTADTISTVVLSSTAESFSTAEASTIQLSSTAEVSSTAGVISTVRLSSTAETFSTAEPSTIQLSSTAERSSTAGVISTVMLSSTAETFSSTADAVSTATGQYCSTAGIYSSTGLLSSTAGIYSSTGILSSTAEIYSSTGMASSTAEIYSSTGLLSSTAGIYSSTGILSSTAEIYSSTGMASSTAEIYSSTGLRSSTAEVYSSTGIRSSTALPGPAADSSTAGSGAVTETSSTGAAGSLPTPCDGCIRLVLHFKNAITTIPNQSAFIAALLDDISVAAGVPTSQLEYIAIEAEVWNTHTSGGEDDHDDEVDEDAAAAGARVKHEVVGFRVTIDVHPPNAQTAVNSFRANMNTTDLGGLPLQTNGFSQLCPDGSYTSTVCPTPGPEYDDDFSPSNVKKLKVVMIAMAVVSGFYLLLALIAYGRDAQAQVDSEEKLSKWRKKLGNEERVTANFFGEEDRDAGRLGNEFSFKTFKKAFQAYHLWASVFVRPKGDAFTSVERATVLYSSMFVAMIVTAFQLGTTTGPSNWIVQAIIAGAIGAAGPLLVIAPLFARSGEASVREQFEHETKARGTSVFDMGKNETSCADSYCCYCCGRRFPAYFKIIGFVLSFLLVGACAAGIFYYTIQMGNTAAFGDRGSGGMDATDQSNREWAWVYTSLLAFGVDMIIVRFFLVFMIVLIAWCRAPASNPAEQPGNRSSITGAGPPVGGGYAVELPSHVIATSDSSAVIATGTSFASLGGLQLQSDPNALALGGVPAPAPVAAPSDVAISIQPSQPLQPTVETAGGIGLSSSFAQSAALPTLSSDPNPAAFGGAPAPAPAPTQPSPSQEPVQPFPPSEPFPPSSLPPAALAAPVGTVDPTPASNVSNSFAASSSLPVLSGL